MGVVASVCACAFFVWGGALQEAFKVPLVVQLTDDEKFLFKPDLKLEDVSATRKCFSS